MGEDTDMTDSPNPPNSRSTTPVPPPPQRVPQQQAQGPAAQQASTSYPDHFPAYPQGAQPQGASHQGYYPAYPYGAQPQGYAAQQVQGSYHPVYPQASQLGPAGYAYVPVYPQHASPGHVHQQGQHTAATQGYLPQSYALSAPGPHHPAVYAPGVDSSQASSSRESSVAPSSEGESSAASTASNATQRPDPISRKKRRYDPGDGEPPNNSGNVGNQRPLGAGHNVLEGALFQEIQNQFRQFQGQLDSIAQSVAAEPRDLGTPLATQEDVLKQLLKGYQETTDILRILAQAQVNSTAPGGPSGGGEGQDNNMEVDAKASALQSVKVREEPRERSADSVTLARIVREFFQKAYRGDLADPVLVAQWSPDDGPACTIEDFRLDLRVPPGSPWNKPARGVFVDAFLAQNNPEVVTISPAPTTIANLFVSNFQCTRSRYQLALKKATNASAAAMEVEADRQKRRRRERKRWLYYRRIRAAKCFEETRRHLPMIGLYGIDGMSTDESDHENGTGRPLYQILNKPWRNPLATPTLRTLDALQRDMRFRPVRRAGPGAQPHNRVISSGISGRAPVSGLPSDFYNPQWLSRQSEFVKKNLRIGEESKYDYAHDPHINDLAMGNHGQLNIVWGYA